MEDGDGETRITGSTAASSDQRHKDHPNEDFMRGINNTSTSSDAHEEERQEKYNSLITQEPTNRNATSSSKIIFKGFKKRILAQTQENQTAPSRIPQDKQPQSTDVPTKNIKDKKSETKRGKITEYAQYLGLQPAAKYRCLKCHSSATFCSVSLLKQHQRNCTPAMAPMQGVLGSAESSTLPIASNFRITRKVYLCSACGTYFENWNLFLHMREVHKRHICLFCLGMFGQAERLSYHLSSKHSVPEMAFTSVEDFYNAFKGSCYLICCNCEKVFSETDNFYNHYCSPPPKQQPPTKVCSLCRQTGSHAATCSLALEKNKSISASSQASNSPLHSATSTPVSLQSTMSSSRGIPKRIMKNNRPKLSEVSITPVSCNQRPSDSQVKRLSMKMPPVTQREATETIGNVTERPEADSQVPPVRDTVTETIMEVSRYIEEPETHDTDEKIEEKRREGTPEVTSKREISNEPYDSVTQTIMEVSRCVDEPDEVPLNVNEPCSVNTSTQEAMKNQMESTEASVTEVPDAPEAVDERLNSASPAHQQPGEDEEKEEEKPTLNEIQTTSGPQASTDPEVSTDPQASAVPQASADPQTSADPQASTEPQEPTEPQASPHSPTSPAAHSLFSPAHDLQVSDSSLKEQQLSESNEEPEPIVPTESQTSVSFNTVTTTDRSLVIKICTNRNSTFSVSTTNATANADNSENHDTSRESEENNNGEGSTSEEKTSNLSERERDSVSSYQLNDEDSDSDSEKLAVVDSNVEETEERNQENKENDPVIENEAEVTEDNTEQTDKIVLAGDDVPTIDLTVEGLLDSLEAEALLMHCIEAASPTCVYCNHARQIAVNGKQLGLHMLAEHRFQPQHPAIIIHREQFTARIKKSLDDLDTHYFNVDSYNSTDGTYNVPNVRTYECFHCRFHSAVHKELYLHNRKMHQKTILICIMCKSTFYSYSELLCHLCPGVYSPNINVKYRCCLCPTDSLPSAFRLMVHLRKRHHACDVCLELTGNQQRLSNHVWKHKLHHLCYRCGIAYRNKPDITKHLFWKHGTESVLCKKCLQKKWPHVYHFCIPPTAFVCEECGSSFSRAVALKVHKRLYTGDQPYSCSECSERFISRKLLAKHEKSHEEPAPVDSNVAETADQEPPVHQEKSDHDKTVTIDSVVEPAETVKDVKDSVKKVVDVYDLPPLNLSSSSDSESDNEKVESTKEAEPQPVKDESQPKSIEAVPTEKKPLTELDDRVGEVEDNEEEKKEQVQIVVGIWDNFKSYAASLEMQESGSKITKESEELEFIRNAVLSDHDYCLPTSGKDTKDASAGKDGVKGEENDTLDTEHDYTSKPPKSPSISSTVQNVGCESSGNKKKIKTPRKKKQSGSTSSSDSSSDSDSSSCSCGTNCSCSSSSSGSSSSSSSSSDSDSSASEGSPRKQSNRKDRRKDKDNARRNKSDSVEPEAKETTSPVENGVDPVDACNPIKPPENPLRESDLETDETETDEDFYDEHPQQLANKLLAEKRNQLMLLAAVAPASIESSVSASLNNGSADASELNHSPVPIASSMENIPQQKKRVKTKKRKKSDKGKQRTYTPTVESIKLNIPKSFYQNIPGFASSSPALVTVVPSRSSTPNLTTPVMETENATPAQESQMSRSRHHNVGSGSENEHKRSSKRKRVPKRFYGDSSDEDGEKPPALKWRKVEAPPFGTTPIMDSLPPQPVFASEPLVYRPVVQEAEAPPVAASASESEVPAESSSDSSDSEIEPRPQPVFPTPTNAPTLERSDNLYCYCQCPYDEVSEMIACDGEDCHIEWFHFECVGIMVPPKGKWYCPDCRKKLGILESNEDYFD